MSNTDQASEPTMEEILSSIRRVTGNNNKESIPALVTHAREKAVAPKPEPRLLPEPKPQPMARPQSEPEPQVVKEVATSDEVDQSVPDDHFDLAEAIEAIQDNSQFRRLIAQTDRKIMARVVSAWSDLHAARMQMESNQSQVDAAKLALEGMREEANVSSRTPLDVLDAEKKYLDAQVALISARRDEVVASNELLASVGRLTAEFLHLPVWSYDPTIQHASTRGKETQSGAETGKTE